MAGSFVQSQIQKLSSNLAGLQLKSPVILAAGVLGVTPALLGRALDAGAGAVVSKSIGVVPREGYRNPTVVGVECGYINAIGLANPGVEVFREELKASGSVGPPIIISLFGSTPEEFSHLTFRLEDTMAKAYELNLSCPHVKGVGSEVGEEPELVSQIVSKVKQSTRKPVFVKVSPNVSDIVGIAKAAESAGADGVTAVNTLRAMTIDIETRRPVLSNRIGGLSGPAIKPVAIRCVYEVSRSVKIPVIGCGGVSSWSDAVEFFLAGASAVQVGTALATVGYSVFNAINSGILKYLDRHGFASVKEIVGLSHQY